MTGRKFVLTETTIDRIARVLRSFACDRDAIALEQEAMENEYSLDDDAFKRLNDVITRQKVTIDKLMGAVSDRNEQIHELVAKQVLHDRCDRQIRRQLDVLSELVALPMDVDNATRSRSEGLAEDQPGADHCK